MDSYVVRIYRRSKKRSRVLIGTVEVPGTGGKLAFSNMEDLWGILEPQKGRSRSGLQDSPGTGEEEVSSSIGTSIAVETTPGDKGGT